MKAIRLGFSPKICKQPVWLKMRHFFRTFLCSCGKGRFLFACFVQWCHQYDVTWAATGSGCCKTTSRGPCGTPFCEGHVLHHTGGQLPRSHRRSRSSKGATSKPFGNVDPQGNSQASNTVEILPVTTDCRHCAQHDTTEVAVVEVRRLEGAVAALGEESPHAKLLLTALTRSSTHYLERARKRLAQAKAEVARVTAQKDQCCRCGSSLTQVGAVARFSAVCNRSPSAFDVDFNRPRRHSGEGESNRFNPLRQ